MTEEPLLETMVYGDDESHPIASTELIDVTISLASGGAKYLLVIEQPLAGDERSQKRLLRKIERYLNDFHSADSKQKFGRPQPDRMKIHVHIHPASDPAIFELLEKCKDWTRDNSVSLVVEEYLPSEGTEHNGVVKH